MPERTIAFACDVVPLAAKSARFIQSFSNIWPRFQIPAARGSLRTPRGNHALGAMRSGASTGEALGAEKAEQWGLNLAALSMMNS